VTGWNLNGKWGTLVGGVPLGEVVWAAGYGAFWPLYASFIFEVGWRPKASPLPESGQFAGRSPSAATSRIPE
jgi:hypothetical protein